MEKNIYIKSLKIQKFIFSKFPNFENFGNLKIWKFEDFVVEIFVFENLWFYFLEHIFLHDEQIFCVQMFFCDQVCISSNPRNHLEHSQCTYDDSEGSEAPTITQCLAKIRQIHQIQLHTPRKDFTSIFQSWGCQSSDGSISELKRSWLVKRLLEYSN